MHEWGFCEGILEAVRKRAAGRRVRRVKVRLGVLHRLERDAVQQGFSLAASGSEAQDAILDVDFIPARVRCRLCRHESAAADSMVVCSTCGGLDVEISGGDEMILESLEYERVVKPDAE